MNTWIQRVTKYNAHLKQKPTPFPRFIFSWRLQLDVLQYGFYLVFLNWASFSACTELQTQVTQQSSTYNLAQHWLLGILQWTCQQGLCSCGACILDSLYICVYSREPPPRPQLHTELPRTSVKFTAGFLLLPFSFWWGQCSFWCSTKVLFDLFFSLNQQLSSLINKPF